ncbi:hypothetical protein [Sphingobium sp. B2]|uniref:hypothetical protein n=1 Tax=Sphingobium sp. B2 TaxID=2583228 RepID=UPI0021BDD8C5|nr:hypothetical protein [Sphingobium sp. B2]
MNLTVTPAKAGVSGVDALQSALARGGYTYVMTNKPRAFSISAAQPTSLRALKKFETTLAPACGRSQSRLAGYVRRFLLTLETPAFAGVTMKKMADSKSGCSIFQWQFLDRSLPLPFRHAGLDPASRFSSPR